MFAVLNKQYIIDQVMVWQYRPTTEITSLISRAGMNDAGKFIYFASQPKLDGSQNFNQECDRVESTVSILGCYNGSRIYIYNITDPQLDGIREVTAAHETLHAVYNRMNDTERQEVNTLLETEYRKLQGNKDFNDLISYYEKAEPSQRENELHSIIGTEISNIAPELEAHYKKFFSDRAKVVALAEKYKAVFRLLKAREDELSTQLNELATSVSDRSKQYNIDVQRLNDAINGFNTRAHNGNFSSYSQFNYERSQLIAKTASLETARTIINEDIRKYDQILQEYNSLTSQSKKLYNAIDSTLAPPPSL